MNKKPKVESIDEFLARGGKITLLPKAEIIKKPELISKPTPGGPVTILTYEEADLFYGETRKNSKPKKAKSAPKLDINALPEELRAKFINKLKGETDVGEIFEKESDSSEES